MQYVTFVQFWKVKTFRHTIVTNGELDAQNVIAKGNFGHINFGNCWVTGLKPTYITVKNIVKTIAGMQRGNGALAICLRIM